MVAKRSSTVCAIPKGFFSAVLAKINGSPSQIYYVNGNLTIGLNQAGTNCNPGHKGLEFMVRS